MFLSGPDLGISCLPKALKKLIPVDVGFGFYFFLTHEPFWGTRYRKGKMIDDNILGSVYYRLRNDSPFLVLPKFLFYFSP